MNPSSYVSYDADIEALQVHLNYFKTQREKWREVITAEKTSFLCITMRKGDREQIMIEVPKIEREGEVQGYMSKLANDMADYYQSKVLILDATIEKLRTIQDGPGNGSPKISGSAGVQPGDVAPSEDANIKGIG